MKTLALFFLLTAALNLQGQQVNNFNLVNVLNNQPVSLDTYPSCEGMVIVFMTNNCPYDEYYRNRIGQISQAYQDKVPVILVNAGTEAADSKENMVTMAKQKNITLPYLADKDQVLMSNLDARKSPEA